MDNISSIRQNREVERLRMWTGETEEVSKAVERHTDQGLKSTTAWWCKVNASVGIKALLFQENMDMYSRVKRRKSMRRSTFNMPAHHKVMGKTEEEEEGTEGQFPINVLLMNQWSKEEIMKSLCTSS